MKPVLVCLHGWGGSKASFLELQAALAGADIDLLAPDLPGFGAEPEPDRPWALDNYVDWADGYIRTHAAGRRLHLLGHSHGGRIALTLAARKALPIEHLYLCASAGISRPAGIRRLLGKALAAIGKAVFAVPGLSHLAPLGKKMLYTILRVHDYERASPVMQKTMALVIAGDLRPLLPLISPPTDIFWGTDDRQTPYRDALVIREAIAGSVLHSYPGIGHRVHRDRAPQIAEVIRARLNAPESPGNPVRAPDRG
jgi:pimeloyl-ACP methyl ester carboxylesterase